MSLKQVRVTPKNFPVTNEQKSMAVWLLKKYTSYAWVKRTKEALQAFTGGYEKHVAKMGGSQWWRENLQGLQLSLSGYESALAQFEKGNTSKARDFILEGVRFTDWLEDPRAEITEKHVAIGYRSPPKKSVGLYAFGALAMEMAYRSKITLLGGQKFPEILTNAVFPEDIKDLLDPLAPISIQTVEPDEEFHTTGIWLPVSHPLGCPAYASAGDLCEPIEVPSMELIQWETEADMAKGGPPSETSFLYEEVTSKMVLLWKDDRYERGKIPDESVYLDPTVALPTEPAIAPPATEEDYL